MPERTRIAPGLDTEIRTQFQAGGGDRICHLLDDTGEPLCGKKIRHGGLPRKSHLIPGAKAENSPCPACGRPRCPQCAEGVDESGHG
jgi:hypothetical protein